MLHWPTALCLAATSFTLMACSSTSTLSGTHAETAPATAPGYVLLPVKSGAEKRVFRLRQGERVLRYGSIEWAESEPDYYVGVAVDRALAEQLRLSVDEQPQAFELADSIPGDEMIYQEPERPQVHFSAQRGWLNDPNGLVYHDGIWHLYYQHNPYGSGWGNMHWGHALSTDLMHWQEQPIAIRPIYSEQMRDFAFSGSAFYDARNTLALPEGPALVAAYTSTGRGECLAYSYDNGQSWADYPGNPVLVHGNSNDGTPGEDGFWHDSRDPKVFWYSHSQQDVAATAESDAAGHWVMVVYEQYGSPKGKPEDSAFAIYISDNLRDWQRTQVLKTWYECVELFKLPVDGDPQQSKWVLIGAHGFYQIGQFNGREFHPDPREGSSDRVVQIKRPYTVLPGKYHGPYWDAYAGQAWNDVPSSDGRRIYTTWVRGPKGGARHFSQKMSIPVELSLKTTRDGLRLHYQPVRELELLERAPEVAEFSGSGAALDAALAQVDAVAFRMRGVWRPDAVQPSSLSVHGMDLVYDPISGTLDNASLPADRQGPEILGNNRGTLKRIALGLQPGEAFSFELIADQGVLELFLDDGRHYAVAAHIHTPAERGLQQRNLSLEQLSIAPLNSIWE